MDSLKKSNSGLPYQLQQPRLIFCEYRLITTIYTFAQKTRTVFQDNV